MIPEVPVDTGNCYNLPPAIYDKYFADARDPLVKNVAVAICGRCAIRQACLTDHLSGDTKSLLGIRAGVPVHQINVARGWIRYELGWRDNPPRDTRPAWLPQRPTEAREAALR